jgi:hypothetical protein
MALKTGTENKRNVIIAGVLFCVLAYLLISQLFGGPSTPAPAPARPVATRPSTGSPAVQTAASGGTGAATAAGPAAHKLTGSGLDPALHMEKLAAVESIEYAGSGRNIFSADSAPPVAIETAAAPPRPEVGPVEPAAYVPPQPPAIELKYFGYSASKDGARQAFLLHGEDIFEAAAGEIVNHRYKVVAVDAHSVQVTDLSYNNTQTLPLTAN